MTSTTRGRTAVIGAVIASTLCTGTVGGSAAAADERNATPPEPPADLAAHRAVAAGAAAGADDQLVEPSVVRARETRSRPMWPVHDGEVTSPFGSRGGRLHRGIDIAAPTGTPIRAVADGIVLFAGVKGGYGNTVELDHGDGRTTLSAHQSELLVDEGEHVDRGQVIGAVGTTGSSTGPHLHFEYRASGGELDPLEMLPAA